MNRQEFLKIMGGAAMSLVASPLCSSQEVADPKTYIYKTIGGLDLKADVYGADEAIQKPVVIWIHGGALIFGSRKSISRQFKDRVLNQGYALVSIDYRLAPETKLPGIIEDVQDAHKWVRESGPKLFHIHPERLVVSGESAGGYLTLMSGFCLKPRPRALVSYYGYGDIDGAWYSRPDPFYLKQPPVSKEEAYQSVGTTAISEPPSGQNRGHFYLYCRQQGLWPKEVAGHDPDTESKWFDKYCPVRNVSAKYPPTMLIHGTADTDVPYEESKNMAAKLEQAGVEHEFITVPGAGHVLAGTKPEERVHIAEQAMAFIQARTGGHA